MSPAEYARFIFVTWSEGPCDPLTVALLAGYAAFDWWGRLHLTESGAAFLEEIDA